MNIEQVDNWAKKIGEAWVAQDPDAAMALVSKQSIEWYENPLDDAITSWNDVYKLWEVIPHNQKEVSFSYKVIACSDTHGVINWQAKLTKLPSEKVLSIDGIFVVTLDKLGLCTFFKQWEVETSS